MSPRRANAENDRFEEIDLQKRKKECSPLKREARISLTLSRRALLKKFKVPCFGVSYISVIYAIVLLRHLMSIKAKQVVVSVTYSLSAYNILFNTKVEKLRVKSRGGVNINLRHFIWSKRCFLLSLI